MLSQRGPNHVFLLFLCSKLIFFWPKGNGAPKYATGRDALIIAHICSLTLFSDFAELRAFDRVPREVV